MTEERTMDDARTAMLIAFDDPSFTECVIELWELLPKYRNGVAVASLAVALAHSIEDAPSNVLVTTLAFVAEGPKSFKRLREMCDLCGIGVRRDGPKQ